MATNLQEGEMVLVPRSRLGLPIDAPSAFYETKVLERSGRSVKVSMPDGGVSRDIATSAVWRKLGIWCVRIGDLASEAELLDPLAKSILHFSRLLLPGDRVQMRHVRSLRELETYWKHDHGGYTHVVIMAHGSQKAVYFGVDGDVDARTLAQTFDVQGVEPKVFLSLSCNTGYATFGKEFSSRQSCKALVAPFHAVHGALSSQFCQTFLGYHMLQGESLGVAFKHARDGVAGHPSFRLWEKGKLRPRTT